MAVYFLVGWIVFVLFVFVFTIVALAINVKKKNDYERFRAMVRETHKRGY